MDSEDAYDYSVTKHHLEPFVNPVEDGPFISEMEDSYGKLFQFKSHVASWSFGVNRWKDYVFLRYKVTGQPSYLVWNLNEKVMFIDAHHNNYVAVVLREVDDAGKAGKHCHSIVLNVNSNQVEFDLENLMTLLEGSEMESLNQQFIDSGYLPWKTGTGKATATKLSLIFQTLDRYALSNVQAPPSVGGQIRNIQQRESTGKRNLPFGSGGGRSRGTQPSQPMPETQTQGSIDPSPIPPSMRRRKSLVEGATGAGSSGSTLTSVGTQSEEPMEEFQRHALIQREFWAEHKQCFLFDQNTVSVDIKQCVIAKEQYIIRALQEDMVKSVKEQLIQLIDIKQRQKVCLTPVDRNNQLLKMKPQKWEDIENGQFMIINGQHSITASKELQKQGCDESRRVELQRWDAYIVWTLDPNKLRHISRFYNATNHLDYAQPTWGNQIISCRNIWIACKRPTLEVTDHVVRQNKAVYSLVNYKSFTDAVVDRFQNINPKGDGATIRGPSDLKNEIQIITLSDELWDHWKLFLTKHGEGELIDPATLKMYKENKGYKLKPAGLRREFFKHAGHFTDKDFGKQAQHLLGITPGRAAPYPKLSVSRMKVLAVDNMTSTDWTERRKRKKIVIQDLMSIKPDLKLVDSWKDIINERWRSWKSRHRFSSATWDFLLSHIKADYFKKRLRNDAWLKHVTDLEKEFPDVLHMYNRFMKLKYSLPELSGGVEMRGMDVTAKVLVTTNRFTYCRREVNLAVVDTREVPRSKPTAVEAAIDPFLDFLDDKLEPSMSATNVWLFILRDSEDVSAAVSFADMNMAEYDILKSKYIPCKAEMLNNVTNRSAAPDVPLLFLFKKENEFASSVRDFMKSEYRAPSETCPYYKDAHRNTECKWRIHPTELRMEFYLEILQAFAVPGENVLGIYTGVKLMLAAKMFGAFFYSYVDKHDAKGYRSISYFADKLDKNDFMHSNSSYSLTYVQPPRRGPVMVLSDSPPSPSMTLESPIGTSVTENRVQIEELVSSDPGLDGINEFGTNTFQMRAWLSSVSMPTLDPTIDPVTFENLNIQPLGLVDVSGVSDKNEPAQPPCNESQALADVDPIARHVMEDIESDMEFDKMLEDDARRAENVGDVGQAQVEEAVGADDELIVDAHVPDLPNFIDLGSDDDVADHPRESDDDEENDDGAPKQKEMKPLLLPTGSIIKVEKDYWRLEEEKRAKRIERIAARAAKDKELADANAKIMELQIKSQAQISDLSSQFEQLKQLLSSQSSQQPGNPLVVSQAGPSHPPLPVSTSPIVQELVAGLPHPRVDDNEGGCAVTPEDVVVCTPTSQVPRISSPIPSAFEVVVPEPQIALRDAGHHPRVDDADRVAEVPASPIEMTSVPESAKAVVERHSPSFDEGEEKVDYGEGKEDLHNTPPVEEKGPSSKPAEGEDDSTQAGGSSQVASEGRREVLRTSLRPSMPPPRRKWLNIVLDLNGVLCQSMPRAFADKLKSYRLEDNVLSHRYPTVIGSKAVFARQNVREFLRQVSEIAHRVIMWFTMMKHNAEPIAGHLFSNCRAPFDILGQEQCSKVEVALGKFFHRRNKVFCLKIIEDGLFSVHSQDPFFNDRNTLLIDDSPEKSICNDNGNALFLETWSHSKRRDDVLMDELLPWLRRLHSTYPDDGMQQYVNENRIGLDPSSPDDDSLQDIIEGMKESAKVKGVRFLESLVKQKITRSLLSGSEKARSSDSKSDGGSCETAPFSKPYMLRSAADAASAAIDYSKGDIEDGVVDSPPSRGPGRTPICSPSPLKRTSSSHGRSASPTSCMGTPTSRKLKLPVDNVVKFPRLEDDVQTSTPLASIPIVGVESDPLLKGDKEILLHGKAVSFCKTSCDGNPSPHLKSRGARRTPSSDSLLRQRIVKEQRHSMGSKSTKAVVVDLNPKPILSRPPLKGPKSHSTLEVPENIRRPKRKARATQSLNDWDTSDSRGRLHYPSRRDDILRGLAKVQAMEAAKIESSETKEKKFEKCANNKDKF